jgi:ankyrin repeat protein
MVDNNENIILRHHSIFSLLQERENLLEEIESLKNQLRDAGISPVRNHGRLSAPELSQPKRSSFSETNTSLRPESEDVRQIMCTYDKRSGTTDLGKQYEYLMCAFYGLRFATSDHVVDFEMTTNHQIYGDFDDICLRVKFVHGGEHTYLLQLKHTENKKRLTGNVLAAEKGDFSLLKYLKSFQNLARSDLTYILFTNRTASFEEETRLSLKDVEIVAKQHEEIVSEDLLNTNHAQESVFQFDTVEEEECCMKQFLHRFYLFANQCSVAKVKICIADNLKQLLECDIFDSFTSFMKTWWGGNFILTKNDIIAKLAELALSPYIQTISDEKCTERSRILTTAIRQFDLTLVQNLDGLVEKVWSEEVEVREVSIAAHKYGVTCQSMSNLEQFTAEQSTKVEWYLDKTPLIVKVNQAKRGQIKGAVSLLERIEPKKKVLLIGDFQKDDFPHWKVFETLYDLPEDLYDLVVQNFEVSLQGRNPICLERLFDTPRTSKIIGTRELFQMTQDALLIGDKTIDLPESYIPRTVSSNFLDVERVLNNCLNSDDLLIIIATPQFRKFLETANLNFSELVGYHQKSDSSIVLTTKCTKSQFDRVARATTKRRVHLIQILGDGSASLVLSTDNTFQSEEIRCEREPIREDEIHSVFDRPINVLCAQPGIGKSTMIKYLAKTCPPDCWSVRVNLRKFNSLLKQEPEEEEILLHFLGLEGIGNHMLLDKIKWLFFKNRKIYLFLDGLDEIESNCVDFALDYVNYIASTGVHVWVSSRQNLQEAVTTRLNIFPIDIQKLNQNEQQKYIDERLKTRYQPYEIQKISKEIFDSTVVARTHNMLGIPLQLYIITENFLDDRELYKKLSQGIFVLTKMYQIFFEGKRKHLYEKAGVQNDQQLGFNFKLHLELYEIPALKCCLDQNAFNKLQLQLNHQDHDFLETIKSEGDSFGIISQINDEDRAVFTHQTYAEYFASVWFKKNFDKLRLLRDEFNSDKYENLRMIFDIMLAQNCPLHLAVIYRNREQVKKHLGNVDMRDEGGRSPLHLICSYGSKHIPLELEGSLYLNHFYHDESQFNGESLQYREIFRDLSRCDPFELDAVFQWTPLDYAVQFQSLYPVEQFLDRHGDKINLDNLYKTLKTVNFAYYASKLGYPNLLVAAIAKNPNVVFFRIGEDKLSFLHVAVKGVNALALPKRGNLVDFCFVLL